MGAVLFAAAIASAWLTGFIGGHISAERGGIPVAPREATLARRACLAATILLMVLAIKTGV